jgi:hypothetical protein
MGIDGKYPFNIQDKINIARWMLKNNDSLILGGSLSLHIRGCNLMRPIGDIDFIRTDRTECFLYPPLTIIDADMTDDVDMTDDDEDINDEDYGMILRVKFLGLNMEILNPINHFQVWDEVEGMRLSTVDDLMSAKRSYLENDISEEYNNKTVDDIERILNWKNSLTNI